MSKNKSIFKKYTQIGKSDLGNQYSFISTNLRSILGKRGNEYTGFSKAFNVIKKVESKPRDEWDDTNRAGQEKEKQHTVKMRESKFFMVKNNAFELTSRGKVFEKMVHSDILSDIEKRLLCYLLILPAYFSKTPNYIMKRTEEIFESIEMQNLSSQDFMDSIEHFIRESSINGFKKEEIFLFDYTYFDTFTFDFDNVGFLNLFSNSERIVKEQFKENIYQRAIFKENDTSDILLKKFRAGGNYTLSTLIDNAWISYVTKIILDNVQEITDFDMFINLVIEAYNNLFKVNIGNVKKFIYDIDMNKSVFNVIYSELFNVQVLIYEVEKDLTELEIRDIGNIDNTDGEGRARNIQVIYSMKKIAKAESNHSCECETLEGCKYFTSKDSGRNYLEIHHLIPREFANDFDVSIEVLSNYVALCPSCHRKIHHAVDREREHLIRSLLTKRIDKLKLEGLNIDYKTLFKYYGIDNFKVKNSSKS